MPVRPTRFFVRLRCHGRILIGTRRGFSRHHEILVQRCDLGVRFGEARAVAVERLARLRFALAIDLRDRGLVVGCIHMRRSAGFRSAGGADFLRIGAARDLAENRRAAGAGAAINRCGRNRCRETGHREQDKYQFVHGSSKGPCSVQYRFALRPDVTIRGRFWLSQRPACARSDCFCMREGFAPQNKSESRSRALEVLPTAAGCVPRIATARALRLADESRVGFAVRTMNRDARVHGREDTRERR